MEKLLLIDEVAAQMRVTPSTVRRWLSESRKGQGCYPLSISPPGSKLLWRESDIAQYIESQNPPPVCPPIATSFKKQRREEKAYQTRQAEARAVLERHRKPK